MALGTFCGGGTRQWMRCVVKNMTPSPLPLPEGCNGASLTPGYYRGWMTAPEAELFENNEYDKFNKMADAYNSEHGFPKKRKRKMSARERERESEYIQYYEYN